MSVGWNCPNAEIVQYSWLLMLWDWYSQYMLPHLVYVLFIQDEDLSLIVVQATTETCTWKDVCWQLVVSLKTS